MTEDPKDTFVRSAALEKESSRAGYAFIDTDLDTSLTFVALAQNAADDQVKRERNRANARRGYEAVMYFLGRFGPEGVTESELAAIHQKLGLLRTKLKELGEEL